MLLSRGFTSNVGHMLACAVILCHLQHTRATGPALWEATVQVEATCLAHQGANLQTEPWQYGDGRLACPA
jgi:hypothetical protein